jgi:hypothetical protein
MESINIKAYPDNSEQVEALKAFMKALKIKFELRNETGNPYSPEFTEKIMQGDEDLKSGKGRKVTLEELDSLWK